MKLVLKAAQPARAIARREMAMARARERLERFGTDFERHMERRRVTGSHAPFDRETKSAINEVLALLKV